MKLRYFIYSSLFLAFCNTSAIAEENKPFTTQFSIGYMSQYISSGIDQNGNKGSAFVSADIISNTGIYVGAWTAEVDSANGAGKEIDYYIGYKGKFSKLNYDVGHKSFYYSGTSDKGENSGEFYVNVEAQPFDSSVILALELAKNDQGTNDEAKKFIISKELYETNISFNIGEVEASNDFWGIAASKSFYNLDFELAYINNSMKESNSESDKEFLTLTISKEF